jgi:hypothetical protein
MHFDGNGTDIRDERLHIATVTAGAIQSRSQSMFGGSSCSFDGVNGKITLAEYLNALVKDFYFAGSNFTIEGWFKTAFQLPNGKLNTTIIERNGSPFVGGHWAIVINVSAASDGHIGVYWGDYSTAVPMIESGTNYLDNQWHHVAFIRNGNQFLLFVDGAYAGSRELATAQTDVAGTVLTFGNSIYANRGFPGYLDEWRITKGFPRYTVSFTPNPPITGQAAALVSQQSLRLPNPPDKYDPEDERQTRRLIEAMLK